MYKNFFSLATRALTMALVLGASLASEAQEQGEISTFPRAQQVDRENLKPHVGVFAGVATPEGHSDSGPAMGVEVGVQPYIPYGLGAEFSTTDIQMRDAENVRRTLALARASYNFGGDLVLIRHSYLAANLGLNFQDGGAQLAGGPMLGFDIPLRAEEQQSLSLGANAKYLFIAGDKADSLAVNGILKYWF